MIGLATMDNGAAPPFGGASVMIPFQGKRRSLRVPAGIDGRKLGDLLSAVCEHERWSVRVLRTAAGLTCLAHRAERFDAFGDAATARVEALESLIASSGGDPSYLSAEARLEQGHSARILEPCLLDGLDDAAREVALLDAVVEVERKGQRNRRVLDDQAGRLPDSPFKRRFEAAASALAPAEAITWAIRQLDPSEP